MPDLDVLQTVFPGGVVSLSKWMQRPLGFCHQNPGKVGALRPSATFIRSL